MAKDDPASFFQAVQNFEKVTWSKVNLIIKALTSDFFEQVIKDTPVDTGRAKNSWFFGVNKSVIKVSKQATKKNKKTYSKDNTKAKQVRNAIARAPNMIKKGKHVASYTLTNSTPYIHMLEYGEYPSPSKSGKTVGGFSSQALGGFVFKNLQKYANLRITKIALR